MKVNTVAEFLKRNKRWMIITASCIAVAAVVLGAVASVFLPNEGRIAKGVSMNGVNLGGMTVEEAKRTINDSGFFADSIEALYCGESVVIRPQDIELEVDEGKSALMAYEIGHSGQIGKRLLESLKLLTVGVDIAPSPTYNVGMLDSILHNNLGVIVNGEGTPMTIEDISETEVRITPPIAGQDSDVTEARNAVIDELTKKSPEKEVEVVLYKSETTLSVDEFCDRIRCEAANAHYSIENNELIILDEVVGRELDRAEAERVIDAFNRGEAVVVAVTKNIPEITAETLNNDLFGTTLATYKSNYATSTANRAFNVQRAANSCNGIILLPDEVFSYNKAIGNPSLANGYKIASVYENGKQTEGVGGGVCQVSSTIYSAVLYANLEIVERRSHSLTVGYVPKGQDATVSYGTLDFKFKNNTGKPIKLSVTAKGGVCTVEILGSKPETERSVKVYNTTVATTNPTDNITYDEALADGTRKVTAKGKTGYVVDSVRKVYENGVEVSSEKLTRSIYKMVPNEVTVGTKAEPSPEPTVTPSPIPSPTAPEPTSEPESTSTPQPVTIPEETPEAEV